MPVHGSAGGRETLRRYGVEHFRQLGRKGFESFTNRYFQGDRAAAGEWLRMRAYEQKAETFAQRELDRRMASGQEVASVELPVYSTDDEGIPF
jgi:hypothetical protein